MQLKYIVFHCQFTDYSYTFGIIQYNCRFMLNFAGGLNFETIIKALKKFKKACYRSNDFRCFISGEQPDLAGSYVINYQ